MSTIGEVELEERELDQGAQGPGPARRSIVADKGIFRFIDQRTAPHSSRL